MKNCEKVAKEVHDKAAEVYKQVTKDKSGVCPAKELLKEAAKGAASEWGAETLRSITQNQPS